MAQILDYVWVNEEYEISMESISSNILYDNINDIPPYCFDYSMIKPNQVFRNPFKSANDLIILCDVYYLNNLTEPPQIIIAEHNQRKSFNDYMEQYPNKIFKITQKHDKTLFRQHKQMCNYAGIDIFGRPCEYSIFTEKENVYNYVWVSRYILHQLSLGQVEWGELLLIPNTEEDIENKVKSLDMCCIDELFDTLIL
tara:strand:- start:1104 stop:1694 length:591 start_codon:yes stop_codon:yes gene_type:complete